MNARERGETSNNTYLTVNLKVKAEQNKKKKRNNKYDQLIHN